MKSDSTSHRTAKKTALGALALFCAVFAVLSFRLTFGLDPSNSYASKPATGGATESREQGDGWFEGLISDDDDDEGDGFPAGQSPAPQTQAS